MQGWFPADKQLPNPDERVRVIRELGQALLDDFDGSAAYLVAKANGSADRLVRLVVQHLPGFRDCSIYRGKRVDLYKRAQILVGDLWASYGRRVHAAGEVSPLPFSFSDISCLTMFADYRVPQILRSLDVLVYSDSLAQRVDSKTEIASGSEEEIEIRAATVVAVEKLHQALVGFGISVLVIELDWLLWQRGEEAKDQLRPAHRTKTIYY